MGLPGTAATHVSWYNSQKSIWQHLLRLDAYTAYPGDPTSTDTPGGGKRGHRFATGHARIRTLRSAIFPTAQTGNTDLINHRTDK